MNFFKGVISKHLKRIEVLLDSKELLNKMLAKKLLGGIDGEEKTQGKTRRSTKDKRKR